ncbi:MAG: glycosyltransferase [Eubacteriales bacterium]|nr:glycosyltransferase [Eubacteriales bacterium]
MGNPKVSIIVPVYKVEPYLRQCVDSIRNQTLRDIEIILVDDGSPDGCPQMCDQFALEDERIRVFHQENVGVSVARNRGIEEAAAEWLMFVDSDDWLELNAVEKLWKKGEETGAEIILASHFENYPDRQLQTVSNLSRDQVLPVQDFKNALLGSIVIPAAKFRSLFPKELQDLQLLAYPFAKLYKKSVLINEGIRFRPGLKYGEDKIFNIQMLLASQTVYYSASCAYHYRMRAGSVSKSAQIDSRLRLIREMETVIDRYHLGEEFLLYWRINVVNIIFALTELRGMSARTLKACADYAHEMRTFSEDEPVTAMVTGFSVAFWTSFSHISSLMSQTRAQ